MSQTAKSVQLRPAMLQGFDMYIRGAEAEMEQTLHSGLFLWSNTDAERSHQVGQGDIVAQYWRDQGSVQVPAGLIHDWIGAVFVPGSTGMNTLALLQDYNHHKNVYEPEVIDSKLISRKHVVRAVLDGIQVGRHSRGAGTI